MAVPQPGIFAQGTRSHYHLEFDLRPGAADEADRRRAARPARAAGHRRRVEHRRRLRRRALAPAAPRRRARRRRRRSRPSRAPATPRPPPSTTSGCGRTAPVKTSSSTSRAASSRALAPVATLALEQPGFVYHDSRDLTGFIDGTENPPVEEASRRRDRPRRPAGRGRRARDREKWVHNLDAFHAQTPRSRKPPSGAPSPTASSSTTSPTPRTSAAS